jgi:hypothetical protein
MRGSSLGIDRMLRRLRIQYASDLHLELTDKTPFQPLLKPVAPVLALAGDIGRPDRQSYRDFLYHCSRNWDKVFVTAGNHEFYNTRASSHWKYAPPADTQTMYERLTMCREIASQFSNVHFLEKDRVDWQGVAFLGTTLWTDLANGSARAEAQTGMSDYRVIAARRSEEGVAQVATTDDTMNWHHESRAWLEQALDLCRRDQMPTVVLTHHLPSYDLNSPRFANSPLNPAFASHCDSLIRPPVRAWICGHTHAAANRLWKRDGQHIHGCINPRGYPGEKATGYSREIFVDISTEPDWDESRNLLLAAAAGAEDTTTTSAALRPAGSDAAPAPQSPAEQEQNWDWV